MSIFSFINHVIGKGNPESTLFMDFPACEEQNLWVEYSKENSVFKLWSPLAEMVRLNLYQKGHGQNHLKSQFLRNVGDGLWMTKLKGNLVGKYYTFQVKFGDRFFPETPGIYAQAVGVNGSRAMIIDMEETNPVGWTHHKRPELRTKNDIILYELHVRDYSISPYSGSCFKGKYLGLVQGGTKNPFMQSTGIEHLVELGITHVHLLPVFDFNSIDESESEKPKYNWGYDPMNYNVPEGSYSTDALEATTRIKEFKELVMRLHENGIRVVMDVVFNHTGGRENSVFNLEAPRYYYRHTKSGGWSNASGCGNETASERAMMRKFIIESCKYWATEYRIDGFRFDLMGVHDIETMNILSGELKKIEPTIFVYGEGWTAGECSFPSSKRALKINTRSLNDIAVFSDDIRDSIKGSVFAKNSKGFVNGGENFEESIKFGVVGAVNHPQIRYDDCVYSKLPWSDKPAKVIGYVSCHDNHTLFDKLKLTCPEASEEEIKNMHCLANAIILTSQSIPFLHAGVEFMRSKKNVYNSYRASDRINQIDWNLKNKNFDVFEYYRDLIALRKEHSAFKMPTEKMISEHLHFFDVNQPGVVAYQISDHANGDKWRNIVVVYSGGREDYIFSLPKGTWIVCAKGNRIYPKGIEEISGNVLVPAISMMILYQR